MKKTYLLLVIATLFWGGNFIFAKLALETLNPGFIAAARFFIAGLLLVIVLWFRRRDFHWESIRPKLPILIGSGIIGVFVYNLMMFIGLRSTSATNGALIMGLNPMFTLILSVLLLSAKINRLQLLGILLSFSGVLCVISGGSLDTILHLNFVSGDIMLIASSLSFGLYNVINKKYLSEINVYSLTAFTTLPATVLFLFIAGFESGGHLPAVSAWAAGSIAFMAICGSVLAYYFWNYGVKQIGADNSAIFINLVPLFATFFSVILGKPLYASQLAGGLLIVSGVVITNRFKN